MNPFEPTDVIECTVEENGENDVRPRLVSEDSPFRSSLVLSVTHVFNGRLTWLDFEVLAEE
jgi:hypothetical protein